MARCCGGVTLSCLGSRACSPSVLIPAWRHDSSHREADPERNLDHIIREVLKARRNLVSETNSESPQLTRYPENGDELISS